MYLKFSAIIEDDIPRNIFWNKTTLPTSLLLSDYIPPRLNITRAFMAIYLKCEKSFHKTPSYRHNDDNKVRGNEKEDQCKYFFGSPPAPPSHQRYKRTVPVSHFIAHEFHL